MSTTNLVQPATCHHPQSEQNHISQEIILGRPPFFACETCFSGKDLSKTTTGVELSPFWPQVGLKSSPLVEARPCPSYTPRSDPIFWHQNSVHTKFVATIRNHCFSWYLHSWIYVDHWLYATHLSLLQMFACSPHPKPCYHNEETPWAAKNATTDLYLSMGCT